MSWQDNDTLLEEAVELADTLGGPWPERIAELINHSDLEELSSMVKNMRLNIKPKEEYE